MVKVWAGHVANDLRSHIARFACNAEAFTVGCNVIIIADKHIPVGRQAEDLAKDPAGVATLLCGTKPVGNPNLHYLYTGVQSNLKPYSSTTDFPTAPGRYVVTIVTLGGDYLAPPVTKTFQITK